MIQGGGWRVPLDACWYEWSVWRGSWRRPLRVRKGRGASDSTGTYLQVCCECLRHFGVAGSVSPGGGRGVVGACALGAAGDRAPDQGIDRAVDCLENWGYVPQFQEETVDAATLVPRERAQQRTSLSDQEKQLLHSLRNMGRERAMRRLEKLRERNDPAGWFWEGFAELI